MQVLVNKKHDIAIVEKYLREAVLSVKKGNRLPTIRKIRQDCKVGQSAIDRAIENLRNEGVVEIRSRSGLYSGAGAKPEVKIFYFRDLDSLVDLRYGHFYGEVVNQLFIKLSDDGRKIKMLKRPHGMIEPGEIEQLGKERPCTVITLGINESNYALFENLQQYGYNLLHLLPDFVQPQSRSIVIDDNQLIKTQLEYLVEKGHTKIAYLHRMNKESWSRAEHMRWAAFHHYALELGVELNKDYIVRGSLSCFENQEEVEEAVYSIACLEKTPTAIILGVDHFARAAYRGIRKAGMEPGKDMAVIGVNNAGCCDFVDPSLSSVGFDMEKCYEQLMEALSEIENNQNVETIPMPIKLYERESTLWYNS